MRRSTLFLLVLLVALGLTTVLLASRPSPQGPAANPPASTDAEPAATEASTPQLRGAPVPPPPPAAGKSPARPDGVEATTASGRVEVLVVDEEGRGIAGAQVRLHDPRAEKPMILAPTDRSGRATETTVPVGEIHASATAAGYEGGTSWGEVPAGETLTLRVVLRREVLLQVRVVADIDGSPIAGASIRLVDEGSIHGRTVLASHGTPAFDAGVTDPDGRLTFPIARGRVATVQALAPGYATAGQAVERTGAGPEVELRLGPGITVRGIVRSPSGAGCPDATVWIVPANVRELREDPRVIVGPEGSTLTADPGVMSSSVVELEGPIAKARILHTDAAGRYAAEGFAAGRPVLVLAEAPDGARGLSDPVALRPHVRDVLVDVLLEARSTLVVHASPMEGYTSEGIAVELHRTGTAFIATTGDEERNGYVNPKSPARFTGLGAHTYRLVVRIPGAVPIAREIDMPPEGTTEVTVEGEVGRTLEGVVVDAAGRPIGNAQIQWWTEGAAADGYGGRLTDEAGRFVIQGIAPEATWTVRAEAGTHLGRSVEGGPSDTEPLRIELAARPVLRARLVLLPGMTARPYVWVGEKRAGGETYHTAAVDDEGGLCYAVHSVDAECVVVLLPWEGADVLLGTFRLGPGESRDIGTIHVSAGRTVRGQVLGADGTPVAGAYVSVEHPRARGLRDGMFVSRREAVTGADGTFAVASIHDGPAVVIVGAEDPHTVVVEDGSGDPLTIRMER